MAGWVAGWVVGWAVGWEVGWVVGCLVGVAQVPLSCVGAHQQVFVVPCWCHSHCSLWVPQGSLANCLGSTVVLDIARLDLRISGSVN